jgi:hypothetical protein
MSVRSSIAAIAAALSLTACLGLPPWISLSESPARFGRWPLGSASTPKIITVSNIGDEATGPVHCQVRAGTENFLINCEACEGRPLQPAERCEVSVTFRPVEAGPSVGVVELTAEPDRRKTLALNGVGMEAVPGLSTLSARADGEVVNDGLASYAVTVTALDRLLEPVPNVKVTLFTTGRESVIRQPEAYTDERGEAHGFVASTAAEFMLIGAALPNGEVLMRAVANFRAAPPDALQSTLSVSPGPVASDGVGAFAVVATLRDVLGRPVVGQRVTLTASGSGNVLTQPPPTGPDGSATGALRSTVLETKEITAKAGEMVIAQRAIATFSAGAPSAAHSTMAVSPSEGIPANGVSAAVVTLQLNDSSGNPVAGARARLEVTGPGASVTQPGLTDASGRATGAVTSTSSGRKTVTLMAGGLPLYSVELVFVFVP